jgi:hypothetical protein
MELIMRRDEHRDEPNDRLPIVPHESLGIDCCGCLFVEVKGDQARIVCNECGAVIRTGSVRDVEAEMLGLVQTDVICSAACTHCGALNTFSGLSTIDAFVCSECGEGVSVVTSMQ